MEENNKNKLALRISPSLIFVISLSVFLITKMIRAFSGSGVAGGIWNYIQFAFIICGFFVIAINFKIFAKDPIFAVFLAFTLSSLIHGLLYLNFSTYVLFNYLMMAYPVCLLALTYRDSSVRKIENNPIIVITYYTISIIFIFSMLRVGTYSTLTGAVADVYYILGLLPLIYICTKGNNKYLPSICCLLAVVISGKRLGIVLCIVMILLFYLNKALNTKKVVEFILAVLGVAVFSFVVVNIFSLINERFNVGLSYRFQKMVNENDSSGRDIIWRNLIAKQLSSPLVYWITGHGEGAVSAALGKNAHNDFLEILYNFGIFPCIMYISFYVLCIIEFVKMFKKKYEYAVHFLMAIVCSIGLAFVSFYVVTPTYITCGMVSIGYILIDYRRRTDKQIKD